MIVLNRLIAPSALLSLALVTVGCPESREFHYVEGLSYAADCSLQLCWVEGDVRTCASCEQLNSGVFSDGSGPASCSAEAVAPFVTDVGPSGTCSEADAIESDVDTLDAPDPGFSEVDAQDAESEQGPDADVFDPDAFDVNETLGDGDVSPDLDDTEGLDVGDSDDGPEAETDSLVDSDVVEDALTETDIVDALADSDIVSDVEPELDSGPEVLDCTALAGPCRTGIWNTSTNVCDFTSINEGMACGSMGTGEIVGQCFEGTCTGIRAVATGKLHTCIILPTKQVTCFGGNGRGQLGRGNVASSGAAPTDMPPSSVTDYVPLLGPASQVCAGADHSCALLEDGSVQCWGRGNLGSLGSGEDVDLMDIDGDSPSHIEFVSSGEVIQLACGGDHSCVLFDNGKVRCWGFGSYGQLGTQDDANVGDGSVLPIDVDLEGELAQSISLGFEHSCAVITGSGVVRCWGANTNGQLGTNDQVGLMSDVGQWPSTVGSDIALVQGVAAGFTHTCAIISGGQVRCWGGGGAGELASGAKTNKLDGSDPVASNVPGISQADTISSWFQHNCVVTYAGAVKCWGNGANGQLGHGAMTNLGDDSGEVPHVVDLGGEKAVAVAAGFQHSCAILESGRLKCWGNNAEGQLGLATVPSVGTDEIEMPPPFTNCFGAAGSSCSEVGQCLSAACSGLSCDE